MKKKKKNIFFNLISFPKKQTPKPNNKNNKSQLELAGTRTEQLAENP